MAENSSLLTVRHATFELLRSFGLTTVFGNPGSTELPMFRDFPDDFRYVLCLQEAVVVAMADGYAQATRGAALVNLHSAAGVGHAMGNIFTAFRNNTPLIITAGQQARSMLPYDPFLYAAQATEFPKPYVKYSVQPARAADVPAAIARAYYMAIMPPCGPTFVSIPVDDWDAPAQASVIPRTVSRSIRADIEAVATIQRALIAAQSPALVVGPAVDRDGAFNLTVELAERWNAVVYVSPKSARCSFPEDHSLFRGFLQSTRSDILSSLSGHDVILVLGAPAFLYHFEDDGSYAFPNGIMFHLTEDPELAAAAPVGTAILTSVRAAVQDLLSEPPPPRTSNTSVNLPAQKTKDKVPMTHPMTDTYLMQTLHSIRPKNSIIVEEASSSRPAIQKYLPMIQTASHFIHMQAGVLDTASRHLLVSLLAKA